MKGEGRRRRGVKEKRKGDEKKERTGRGRREREEGKGNRKRVRRAKLCQEAEDRTPAGYTL